MRTREFLQVDPATLRLPSSRREGADPFTLEVIDTLPIQGSLLPTIGERL